jgi:acylphosphatase
MSRCMRFVVSGRVQGVAFRAGTLKRARELDLQGFVRNREDGRVEVLACGEVAALEGLRQWLHDGPPLADVREVAVEAALAPPAVDGFRIV